MARLASFFSIVRSFVPPSPSPSLALSLSLSLSLFRRSSPLVRCAHRCRRRCRLLEPLFLQVAEEREREEAASFFLPSPLLLLATRKGREGLSSSSLARSLGRLQPFYRLPGCQQPLRRGRGRRPLGSRQIKPATQSPTAAWR